MAFRDGESSADWMAHLERTLRSTQPALSAPRLRPRPRLLPPSAALLSLHSARPALAASQQRKNIRRRTLHSPHSPTPSPLFPTLSPLSALPHPIPWIPSLSSLPCIPPSHSLSHPFHPSACPRPLSHSVPRNSRSRACPRALDAGAAAREERRGGEKEEEGEGDGEPEEERVGGAGAAATSPSAPAAPSLSPAALRTPPGAGRIAPLLSRSSSFPLPPTAAAAPAAATAATYPAGTPTVDSLEARCLTLRLIGCLAPLAADVAHVQELVVRAAMKAEGQQEVSEVVVYLVEKTGKGGGWLGLACSSLLCVLAIPLPHSLYLAHLTPPPALLRAAYIAACPPLPCFAVSSLTSTRSFPLHPNLHAAILHSKSSLSLLLHPYFPLQLSSHPNLHAALLAATFLCVVSAPFILNPPSFPPFYRFSHLPLPQQTKQTGVKRNVLMSQAEADEHMAVKLQQQQQSDRFPAAQASVQPYSVHPQSFHLSPSRQALPLLALHMTPLTTSSLLPRVSRPLARWRGREEGEEGVRVRVAAVVVKCLAGHEERAVRRVAWQVRRGMGGGEEGWMGEGKRGGWEGKRGGGEGEGGGWEGEKGVGWEGEKEGGWEGETREQLCEKVTWWDVMTAPGDDWWGSWGDKGDAEEQRLPALCLPLCPVVPAAAIVGVRAASTARLITGSLHASANRFSSSFVLAGLVTASWYAPSEASTSSTEPTPINVDLVASSDSSVASTFSSSGDSAAAVAKSAKPAPPLVHAPPAPRAAATRIAPRACRRPLVLSAYDGVLDPELFETTGELGRGGFGTVVAMRRVESGEVVAVKRVERKQLVAASNEAMLSASLSECPGVLGVREVHLGEQHAYMLSDLCSGGDLRALMQRRKAAASNGAGDAGRGNGRRWWGKASGEGGRGGGMAEAEALEVVKHVGDAVAFCHERGVVHCDVKPDNILLATPTPLSAPLTVPLPFSAAAAPAAPARAPPAALGLSAPVSSARTSPRLAAGAVRLADFGLAQVVAEGQRGCSTPAGTPGYMAPEVEALCRPRCPPAPGAAKHARKAAGGAEAGNSEAAGYGRAADVWSLGVTLYEMIAGERPYSGEAPQQGEWRARVEGAAWEGVSEECRALVSGMLRVRAEERLTMAHVCHHPAMIRALGGSGGSSKGKSRSGRWW
ncbi:unnamed protein product [Closterium sp. NIES-65]|nr:unnamed protein product [Closterium sp. NIES-65]